MSSAKLTQLLPQPENGEGYQLVRKKNKKNKKREKAQEPVITTVKDEKKEKKDEKKAKKITYHPIEYFFQQMKDFELVEWLSDRIGVLRSVFELFRSSQPSFKTSINITDNISCDINRRAINNVKVFVPSVDKDRFIRQDIEVELFYLADGTVLMTYRGEDVFIINRFCFEESTDEDFERIVRESQVEPPVRRKK